MPNPNPNQKFEDMPWLDRVNVIRALSLFPAITVMVFIRRKVGFRMVKPIWLFTMTLIMLMVPVIFNSVAAPFASLMVIYALSMYGLGMWQRWQGWCELCRGGHWHTYSPGISYLEKIPWPLFLRSHRRINRWLDPAAVALVGILINLFLSHALGAWIFFSAFFLYVYEQDLYEKQLAQYLDMLDSMDDSDVQAQNAKNYADGKSAATQQRSLEDTAGIPVDLAPEIAEQVKIRRTKRRAAQSDLAPETLENQV
jgi:hypothetical protein